MKIESLKINGFGKIKDKEFHLKDGINVVYGENEAGKSSLLKFITSMLYGASKTKNGKEISDFDKFKPWKTEEFSGKIRYTLDIGRTYEVYREFKKKNPVIFDENMTDISKQFTITKNGIEFFYDQTGIDEETFYNTAITEQEGIRLSKSSQNSIIQKISNLISSGDDNISYKKSIDKITKAQNEKIGSDRTAQRPINVLDVKIRNLLEKRRNLEINKEKTEGGFSEKDSLELELKSENLKREMLKDIQSRLNNNRIKTAEINFGKNLEEEYENKIRELNSKIANEKYEKEKEKGLVKYFVFSGIICILTLIAFLGTDSTILKYLFMALFLSSGFLTAFKIREKNNINTHAIKSEREKILSEIEVLKTNIANKKHETEEKEEKYTQDIENDKEYIIEKYNSVLDYGYIESALNKSYEEIVREIDIKENRIQTINFKLHTINLDMKLLHDKLEDLSSIEEDLEAAEEEREELLKLNYLYDVAKECLEDAYTDVKSNISPKFIQNLCEIIDKISGSRYKNVYFKDDEGLKVEIDNGNFVSASRLSVGTIDQMYLSLRLSALEEISKETLPIILDEAFAYFDNERLKSMLRYLNLNYNKNQIIIFTCSNREKEALEELGIRYNLINLEN